MLFCRKWVIIGCAFVAVVLTAFLTKTSSLFAAEFKLVKGAQYELCQQLSENLKLFPKLRIVPSERLNECKIPFDPRFQDFREVQWTSLDPSEHTDIVREIVMAKRDKAARTRRRQWGAEDEAREDALWQKLRPEIEAKIAAGEIGLGRTSIDVNHDGKPDTVYRYGRYSCNDSYPEPPSTFSWTYHILQRDNQDLSWALRNHATIPYFALYFRGRIYLAQLPAAQTGFYVIEPTAGPWGGVAMISVCKFDFVESE